MQTPHGPDVELDSSLSKGCGTLFSQASAKQEAVGLSAHRKAKRGRAIRLTPVCPNDKSLGEVSESAMNRR